VAAALLTAVSLTLIVEALGQWVTVRLSAVTARVGSARAVPAGQFGVGALLGFVWLPCVGPTLGAAITLASLGQSLPMAFAVMFAFGVGTASVLLAAGLASARLLSAGGRGFLASRGKPLLGWTLLALGLSVLTGLDKVAEAWAVRWMPAWTTAL
jgi:cytochrome c biogenesis protein CcdA